MKIIKSLFTYFFAFCGILTIAYLVNRSGLGDRLLRRYREAVEPPILVAFRPSAQFWKKSKEYVMLLSNKDAQKGIEIEIVRHGKNGGVSRKYLAPAETAKSFGKLEIGSNFVNGEKGYVRAVGYDLVLWYDLSQMDSANTFSCHFERLPEGM